MKITLSSYNMYNRHIFLKFKSKCKSALGAAIFTHFIPTVWDVLSLPKCTK